MRFPINTEAILKPTWWKSGFNVVYVVF